MENNDKLHILLKLGKEISRERDLDKLLVFIRDLARDVLDADRCSIFLYDRERDELWTKTAHGVDEIRISAQNGVAGTVALTKEARIVVDAYNDFRFDSSVDEKTNYRTRNMVTVPLLDSKGDTMGVFQALNKKEGFFTNQDADLLMLVGEFVSSSIEQAYLSRRIWETQIKLVHKLSQAVEFKDNETSEHTRRVACYAVLIAEGIGLSQTEIDTFKFVAPMHDAGKIGIPDNIINKPGRLTKEEFNIIKSHSMIGFQFLMDEENDILKKAATIARDHHEKWDGSGYPAGLKGHEISVLGRIIGIVDVFDALTSKRPYKEPWPLEKATRYLIEQKGVQFDPAFVDLFVNRLDEVKEIHNTYRDDDGSGNHGLEGELRRNRQLSFDFRE
jgi:HD-GYP domain-containing protein (c-di-GMP phosphodiesterase class II)